MMTWRGVVTAAMVVLLAWGAVGCGGGEGDRKRTIFEEATPRLSIPETITFTRVTVGEETTTPLTIANDGGEVLEIDAIKLVEGSEDDVKEFHAGDNWRNQMHLEPGESVDLAVTYAPKNETRDSGRIALETDDPRKA